jgi:HSP20 family protein
MERETSSEASASHWIDQAILDVDHLRQEIVSESTANRNQEGNESAAPEMYERLHAVRETLGELTRAVATHLLPVRCSHWVPVMEVCDKGAEIEASFDLPGVPRSSIRIRAAKQTLFVSGERPTESEPPDSIHFTERMRGPFERAVTLPCQVDASAASALYRDGCLTVRMPKQAASATDDS